MEFVDGGVVDHKIYGKIFAYEVDGRGSVYLSDDANVPSLLSLPYLGYLSADDELYQRTRFFLLSPDNPWFFSGTNRSTKPVNSIIRFLVGSAAEGIGSPHGHGYSSMLDCKKLIQAQARLYLADVYHHARYYEHQRRRDSSLLGHAQSLARSQRFHA
jgi:hypothetical protein